MTYPGSKPGRDISSIETGRELLGAPRPTTDPGIEPDRVE